MLPIHDEAKTSHKTNIELNVVEKRLTYAVCFCIAGSDSLKINLKL